MGGKEARELLLAILIGTLFLRCVVTSSGNRKKNFCLFSNTNRKWRAHSSFKHRYEKNQFYKPHHDYFSDTFNLKRGGQRVATMLIYLSDTIEGGETYFPKAGSGECNCGGKTVPGLSVKPVKGDAVLFWSMGLDGQSDPKSIHGGCEVLAGEKWSATKWMRQRSTLVS